MEVVLKGVIVNAKKEKKNSKKKEKRWEEKKKMKQKDIKLLSGVLMVGAVMAVFFSGLGYLGIDIWLASTQWLLVAAVLALFGLFFKR